MNMKPNDVETDHLLSDDELDAVAGGRYNFENPVVETCLIAFVGAAGAGGKYFTNQFQLCASF
jgi:hypothetical protein